VVLYSKTTFIWIQTMSVIIWVYTRTMNAQLSVYISYFLLINLDIKVSAHDAFSGKTCINSGTFKPGSGGINRCGRSKHSDCSLSWPRLSRGGKSMSITFTFGAKYLTGMVTSAPPSETFSLIKNNILRQSRNYKDHFENSNFWGRWRWSCDIQFHSNAVHINVEFCLSFY
jgi:hypothetical protein